MRVFGAHWKHLDRSERGRGGKSENAAAPKSEGEQAHTESPFAVPNGSSAPRTERAFNTTRTAHRVHLSQGAYCNVACFCFFCLACCVGVRDGICRRFSNGWTPLQRARNSLQQQRRAGSYA